MAPRLRYVTIGDAPQVAAIYDPIVRESVISFELDPPGPEVMRQRIEATSHTHPWIVLEEDDLILGYAHATPYRQRLAYRWSIETTVYVHRDHRGRGLGRVIYSALLERASSCGYASAFAGIAMPNPGSEALHISVGFEPIGVFPRAGFKLGEWRDVSWWYRPLSTVTPPAEIKAPR